MVTLRHEVARLGGLALTSELLCRGFTPHELAAAVHSGELIRARQGCFVLPDTAEDAIRAARVGGRLTGLSAARQLGLATPIRHPLHVHVAANAARLRDKIDRRARLDRFAGDTVIHHHRLVSERSETRFAVSLVDCLRQVVMSEAAEDAVACIDSARHRGVLDDIGVEELRRAVPKTRRHLVDLSSDKSPEYLESVVRVRLHFAGITARTQVNVLDERWIDLLVGDRLALECDGRGKYERGATVDSDRRRDAFLEALGYHVIRISYPMVFEDWDATLAMILALVERGDHLARRRAV